jgi:hypothetical protein
MYRPLSVKGQLQYAHFQTTCKGVVTAKAFAISSPRAMDTPRTSIAQARLAYHVQARHHIAPNSSSIKLDMAITMSTLVGIFFFRNGLWSRLTRLGPLILIALLQHQI